MNFGMIFIRTNVKTIKLKYKNLLFYSMKENFLKKTKNMPDDWLARWLTQTLKIKTKNPKTEVFEDDLTH